MLLQVRGGLPLVPGEVHEISVLLLMMRWSSRTATRRDSRVPGSTTCVGRSSRPLAGAASPSRSWPGSPAIGAGLEGVWVHDLRRSFVTQARRSGLPESVVARFSGHRTAAVFKRYNIVEEQDLKAAVQVLNRTRQTAEAAQSAVGHELGAVDQK